MHKISIYCCTYTLYTAVLTVTICESEVAKPDHKLEATLGALDTKLDYMGTSICMIQLTDLNVSCNDEWIVADQDGVTTPTATPIATNRSVLVLVLE